MSMFVVCALCFIHFDFFVSSIIIIFFFFWYLFRENGRIIFIHCSYKCILTIYVYIHMFVQLCRLCKWIKESGAPNFYFHEKVIFHIIWFHSCVYNAYTRLNIRTLTTKRIFDVFELLQTNSSYSRGTTPALGSLFVKLTAL